MSILFVGDPHNKWDRIVKPVLDYRPEAIVLLGDMGLEHPLHAVLSPILSTGISVYWIPGNHDGDSEQDYANLFESDLRDRSLHAQVRQVAGTRIAGLGGVFRERIWYPGRSPAPLHRNPAEFRASCRGPGRGRENQAGFRDGVAVKYHVTVWPDDYQWLQQQRADILVCHEAPETLAKGFRALGELAETMKVKTIFHGHHHTDYRGVTECGVTVIGVSVAGVVDQDGNVIAQGVDRHVSRRGTQRAGGAAT